MQHKVTIPDVGEATDVEVIEICVAVGDAVAINDVLIVLESDKASMEVPAEETGKVLAVAVAIGDKVQTGSLILTLESEHTEQQPVDAEVAPAPASSPAAEVAPAQGVAGTPACVDAQPTEVAPATEQAQSLMVQRGNQQGLAAQSDTAETIPYAGPGVRRMARELGVELAQVPATGAHGRILKEDVQAYVKNNLQKSGGMHSHDGGGIPAIPEVDFSKFGPIRVEPVGRIAVRSMSQLRRSWLNLPQVTQHEEADITELEAFRQKQKNTEPEGRKLTMLPFMLKACAATLAMHKKLNSSLSGDGLSYVFKDYIHIGIAVDTPDGLLVPVIRDVDTKSIWALNTEVQELSAKARNRKLKPGEMQGASFTVSSLGAIGGTGFTPIVNAPEVAILGVARADWKPVYQGSDFVPRLILPLSLSYDHRVVNGADAGRFMMALKQRLQDFRLVAM